MISNQKVYCIYTDGSKIKNNNSVGTATICPNLNVRISRSIDKDASIFTAESIALIDSYIVLATQKIVYKLVLAY